MQILFPKADMLVWPGLRSIAYLSCSSIPRHIHHLTAAGLTAIAPAGFDIQFLDDAVLTLAVEPDNGDYIEKATLTFKSTSSLPKGDKLGFVVVTNNGESFLLGHHEAPYPKISSTRPTGSGDSAAVTSYEITLEAKIALIPVVDRDN